jgi:hypothetical protein
MAWRCTKVSAILHTLTHWLIIPQAAAAKQAQADKAAAAKQAADAKAAKAKEAAAASKQAAADKV